MITSRPVSQELLINGTMKIVLLKMKAKYGLN